LKQQREATGVQNQMALALGGSSATAALGDVPGITGAFRVGWPHKMSHGRKPTTHWLVPPLLPSLLRDGQYYLLVLITALRSSDGRYYKWRASLLSIHTSHWRRYKYTQKTQSSPENSRSQTYVKQIYSSYILKVGQE